MGSRGLSSAGFPIKIGRENTMFLAFGIEGVGIYALSIWGQDPVLFVILTGPRLLRLG